MDFESLVESRRWNAGLGLVSAAGWRRILDGSVKFAFVWDLPYIMPRRRRPGLAKSAEGDAAAKSPPITKGPTPSMDLFLLLLAIVVSIAFSLGLGAGLLTLLLRLIQTHSS